MRSSGRYIAALLLMAAPPAMAGPADQLIVTGTRLAAEETQLPNAMTVLNRDEIDARGDAGVLDLLRAVPGVQVVQPGAGGVAQLFMRGGEPNFTVFLLDGIKVNDLNNTRGGSFDLASLNLAEIERVEIVRGPQSSIYGSDGLAGVINVISRAGSGPLAATVEVEAGADDFARASVVIAGSAGDGGFSLQATARDDGEQVAGSTYAADTVSGRLRLVPAAGVLANLYGRFAATRSTSFPDQSGGPQFAALRSLDHASAHDVSVGGDLDWALGEALSLQAVASHYGRNAGYASPGIAPLDQVPPNGARNHLDREYAAVRLTLARGDWLTATAGVDFQRESGRSDGYVDFAPDARVANSFALDRDIVGVFVEGSARAGENWQLQASVRHDEPDHATGETTARVGAAYSPNGGRTRLRANWGTGFKLPSFFALGSPLVGNPELRPEKSRSVDAGVIQRVGARGEVSVTLFDSEFDDLIDFDPDAFRNINRNRVTSRGAELGGAVALTPALILRAHATWNEIDVQGSDRKLLQRPKWRGGLAARWVPAGNWSVDLDWLYVGETLDSSIPAGQTTLAAWHRVDLNLGWAATSRLRLSLAVDNFLDAGYAEAVGFPAPGTRLRLSARYRFGG